MTQEEKQLLIKDLCARLPYGVKGLHRGEVHELFTIDGREVNNACIQVDGYDAWFPIETFKPYLRPIKSMTLEECDKLFKILDIREDSGEWLKINDIGVMRLFTENGKDFYEIAEAMDYLYSIHVDFRDLIPAGLAIEAPEGMYKTE